MIITLTHNYKPHSEHEHNPGAANARGRVEAQELLGHEFRALHKAVHTNIVTLIGVVLDHPEWLCLLMECADRGSLRRVLDESVEEIVGQPQVQLRLVRDIVAGMAYLHAHKPSPILHRDLKSDNVLLFSNARWDETFLIAKVTYFGAYYCASRMHSPCSYMRLPR